MPENFSFEHLKGVSYANDDDQSPLQTADIWIPRRAQGGQLPIGGWIILIHGGIWRDPEITAEVFARPAISLLEESSIVAETLNGIASLNYRLSSYPEHPTKPSKPDDPERNVQHPTHLHDVLTGIRYLQNRFKFEQRYMLVGHSCGATLAFQALQALLKESDPNHPAPQAIVGIAGLYDLVRLRDSDEYPPTYQKLISNAFGSNESIWKSASPADRGFEYKPWSDGKAVLLARCNDDEYVPKEQLEVMSTKIRNIAWVKSPGIILKEMILSGKHDDCWKDGTELARCIVELLEL